MNSYYTFSVMCTISHTMYNQGLPICQLKTSIDMYISTYIQYIHMDLFKYTYMVHTYMDVYTYVHKDMTIRKASWESLFQNLQDHIEIAWNSKCIILDIGGTSPNGAGTLAITMTPLCDGPYVYTCSIIWGIKSLYPLHEFKLKASRSTALTQ